MSNDWVMVPKAATDAMYEAGNNAACREDLRWCDLNADEVYAAMLAAAPPAPQSEVSEELRERVLAAIPSNWCDPLLTGPDAVVGNVDCPTIERLLNAIRERVSAALAARDAGEVGNG